MPTSSEQYIYDSEILIEFLREIAPTGSGLVDRDITEEQNGLVQQLKRLIAHYKTEFDDKKFIKNYEKFSNSIMEILTNLDQTEQNEIQSLKLQKTKALCDELLTTSLSLAATKITSCHVIDIMTGARAINQILPLVKENLRCLQGATVDSIQGANSIYSVGDADVVKALIDAINREPIISSHLNRAQDALRAYPLSYALLTDVLNYGGGPQKCPPHPPQPAAPVRATDSSDCRSWPAR